MIELLLKAIGAIVGVFLLPVAAFVWTVGMITKEIVSIIASFFKK